MCCKPCVTSTAAPAPSRRWTKECRLMVSVSSRLSEFFDRDGFRVHLRECFRMVRDSFAGEERRRQAEPPSINWLYEYMKLVTNCQTAKQLAGRSEPFFLARVRLELFDGV